MMIRAAILATSALCSPAMAATWTPVPAPNGKDTDYLLLEQPPADPSPLVILDDPTSGQLWFFNGGSTAQIGFSAAPALSSVAPMLSTIPPSIAAPLIAPTPVTAASPVQPVSLSSPISALPSPEAATLPPSVGNAGNAAPQAAAPLPTAQITSSQASAQPPQQTSALPPAAPIGQPSSCGTGSLNYSASSGNSLLLQAPDGTFNLIVWSEGTPEQDTINLGQQFGSVRVIDPIKGTAPIATSTNTNTVSVGLSDHPLVIQLAGGPVTAGQAGTKAASVADFADSIGVTTHLTWGGTSYANPNLAAQELAYLGVTNVRDGPPSSSGLGQFQMLADLGVKFDLVTGDTPRGETTATLPSEMALIDALARSNPGSVQYVEAPNELNSQLVYMNGVASSDPSAAVAIVKADSSAVYGDRLLTSQGVQLANVSINNCCAGWQDYVKGLGDLSPYVGMANFHVYTGGEPAAAVQDGIMAAQQSAPGRPVLFTEAGYTTATAVAGFGVDQATQATRTLNLLADTFTSGVSKTYLYELMDGAANPDSGDMEDQFGLFLADGTPKPVATAIHNLLDALSYGTTISQAGNQACAIPIGAAQTLVPQTSLDVIGTTEFKTSSPMTNLTSAVQ